MAGAANERLRQLRQPTAFRQALFEARHELELERARPTMPPIRIAPPGRGRRAAGRAAAAARRRPR